MVLGIVRTLQLAATLVVAGPIGMVGVFNVLEGRPALGAFFVLASLGLVLVSEYIYIRLTSRTLGGLRRVKNVRGGE
ncbi:MAG: hypothetical protein RI560_10510 [Natronomonas sp.]|jgi:hypothetical protein|uniref:DUF7533 family protein n=1 Tax=Natronomonas sp. TaxID=2184060 RepID=UPI0028702586|nr:hypothetical protein [Natronomonas sp.]MDR9382083.1 hypothetical protein [Natronomonas sp.]MDR9431207.1 hypothetical protein [Natronomonas sp.]